MKRIVIACGGTGGHFYPGYVLGKALRERGWETLFLLRSEDPAAEVLVKENLPFVEVDLRGMPRSISPAWPGFLWRLGRSLWLTRNLLRAYRPRCVIGMGGYLTVPAVIAARWLRIPALLHESNSVLGLANRICLPFASSGALGLPLAATPRLSRMRWDITGTPVRPELWKLPPSREARQSFGLAPDDRTVLIFGGSQGAHGINQNVPPALRLLAETSSSRLASKDQGKVRRFQCLHLSGPKEEATVRSAYAGAPFKAVVLASTQEMHKAYATADLVICRAGASTLAELYAARKPAVLIPFPHAAANHQEANARMLERAGAARCVVEKGLLTPPTLAATLNDLVSSEPGSDSCLAEMAGAYGRLGLPAPNDTISALVDTVERVSESA